MHSQIMAANPTQFHLLIASLAEEGRLLRLYTQNIDGIDTQLEPLKTEIPLPSQKPWPKTIQLHGNLRTVRCLGNPTHRFDFDQNDFQDDEPMCRICDNEIKASRKRRSGSVIRPRVLLYGDNSSADFDSINKVIRHDLSAKPDAVVVVGTALKVNLPKILAREMCVKAQQAGRFTAWINLKPPPSDLECFDMVVKGDCEDIAMHVSTWWLNGYPNILSQSGIRYIQERFGLVVAKSPEELIRYAFVEADSNPYALEEEVLRLADERNKPFDKELDDEENISFDIDIADPNSYNLEQEVPRRTNEQNKPCDKVLDDEENIPFDIDTAEQGNNSVRKDTLEPAVSGFVAVNHTVHKAQPSQAPLIPTAASPQKRPVVGPRRIPLPTRPLTPTNQASSGYLSRTKAFANIQPAVVPATMSKPLTTTALRGLNILPELPDCWKSDCTKRLQQVTVRKVNHISTSSSSITGMSLAHYGLDHLWSSLWRLKRGEWLNDEILNAYITLLSMRIPANHHIEYTNIISHILPLNKPPKEPPEYLQATINTGKYTLYIPIHRDDNHWSFGVVISEKKGDTVRWKYFDSLYSRPPERFLRWIKAVFPEENTEEVAVQAYPKQNNSSDCGLFVLLGIRLLSSGRRWLSQEQSDAIIPDLRERILAELLASSLNPSASEYEKFIEKDSMPHIVPTDEDGSSDDVMIIDDPEQATDAVETTSGLFVSPSPSSSHSTESSNVFSDELDISEQEAVGLELLPRGKKSPQQLAQAFGSEESMFKTLREAVRIERDLQKEGVRPKIGNMKLADLWFLVSTGKRALKHRYLHYEFSRKFWNEMQIRDRTPYQRGPIPKAVITNMMEHLEVSRQTNWKYILQWARRALVWIELAELFKDHLEYPSVSLCAVSDATYTLETLTITNRKKYLENVRLLQKLDDSIVARLKAATPLYLALTRDNLPVDKLPIEFKETSLSFEDAVKFPTRVGA